MLCMRLRRFKAQYGRKLGVPRGLSSNNTLGSFFDTHCKKSVLSKLCVVRVRLANVKGEAVSDEISN